MYRQLFTKTHYLRQYYGLNSQDTNVDIFIFLSAPSLLETHIAFSQATIGIIFEANPKLYCHG